MTRHELRDKIFKLLFRLEFNPIEDMAEQIELFRKDEENVAMSDSDNEYVVSKYNLVVDKKDEIDGIITDNVTGWKPNRMGKVELTTLRLGIFEMLYDEDIPVGVAMNEAVELAKNYGQDNSSAFVNAVLTKIKEAKCN